MSAPASKKNVWVMVPFDGAPADAGDRKDPRVSAAGWVKAKNAEGSATKTYTQIGLDDLHKVNFERGDRLYIHGHGGTAKADEKRIYDKGDANHTAQQLHKEMVTRNPDIFKSQKVDVRIASCYSVQNSFAESFAAEVGRDKTSGGKVKGYHGQLNVTEMDSVSRSGALKFKPAMKLANVATDKGGLTSHDKTKAISYPDIKDRTAYRAKNHSKAYDILSASPPARNK